MERAVRGALKIFCITTFVSFPYLGSLLLDFNTSTWLGVIPLLWFFSWLGFLTGTFYSIFPGLRPFRYVSTFPKNASPELIKVRKAQEKCAPYLKWYLINALGVLCVIFPVLLILLKNLFLS